tara:strand:- start:28125 stop:28898 length:774 start_codon:yes stop_codon:yes gene_type:complete
MHFDYGNSYKEKYKKTFYKDSSNQAKELISKYYEECPFKGCGWLSPLDTALLYSTIREHKPSNIMEVGCGYSTQVINYACSKNKENFSLYSFSDKNIVQKKGFESSNFVKGHFFDSWENFKINLNTVDLLYIDAGHNSFFALYYFFELMEPLKSGSLIHIHDIACLEKYVEAIESGTFDLKHFSHTNGNYGVTDEAWTIYYLLNKFKNYEVLFCSSYLNEYYSNKLDFITNIELGKFSNTKNEISFAPSSSLWLKKL